MNNFKLLPLAIVAIGLGITSCNSERDEQLTTGGVELTITPIIQSESRVTTQADGLANWWDSGDQVGVYSTSLVAHNKLFTATSAAAATDFTAAEKVLIPFGTASHDIKAYYPYDAAATATTVTYDLVADGAQPLLWATGSATNAAPAVALKFGHKLGKLRILVDVTNSLTPAAKVDKVTVQDVVTGGTMTIADGVFTPGANKGNLDLYAKTTDLGDEFYTYLTPGEAINGKVIKIEMGGKIYSATLRSTLSVEAGKYYLYTITLKNGSTEVGVGGSTVDGNAEGETGGVDGAPEPETETETETPTPTLAGATGVNFDAITSVLSAPATAGTYDIVVSGLDESVALTAQVAETWVTGVTGATLTRAVADKTVTFALEANTGAERTATVTLTGTKMTSVTFTIKQAAGDKSGETNSQPLFVDNDIASYFVSSSAGFAVIDPLKGKSGGQAILFSGTQKTNNDVFTLNVPSGYRGNPKNISFYVKGATTGTTASTGSFVVKVYGDEGSVLNNSSGFSIGAASSDVILSWKGFSYGPSINTNGGWTKITLDMTTLPSVAASTPGKVLLQFRVNKNIDFTGLLISDFEVQY